MPTPRGPDGREDSNEPSWQSPTKKFLEQHKKSDLQKRCRDMGLTKVWVKKEQLIDILNKSQIPTAPDAAHHVTPPAAAQAPHSDATLIHLLDNTLPQHSGAATAPLTLAAPCLSALTSPHRMTLAATCCSTLAPYNLCNKALPPNLSTLTPTMCCSLTPHNHLTPTPSLGSHSKYSHPCPAIHGLNQHQYPICGCRWVSGKHPHLLAITHTCLPSLAILMRLTYTKTM